jgi:Flp pilus assembly pilin Flp
VQRLLRQLWCDERGQDIAEYAVMLAVILVIVVGTVRLIGTNANNPVVSKDGPPAAALNPRIAVVRVSTPQFFLLTPKCVQPVLQPGCIRYCTGVLRATFSGLAPDKRLK